MASLALLDDLISLESRPSRLSCVLTIGLALATL